MAAWETSEAGEGDVDDVKAEIKAKIDLKPFAHLNLTGIDGDHLNELFNSPKWGAPVHALPGLRHLHVCVPDLPVL